jgi:hypothetical protein
VQEEIRWRSERAVTPCVVAVSGGGCSGQYGMALEEYLYEDFTRI